ncbi:Uncharacterised protein [Orientia tsutsugamushi]|uniref:Immunity MXAN-0049 protein domain-containing protein n=1 Tax=Orientia tsutsugamushi TaxID=784 RepID=A0A2U3R4D4_ORITS|nr:DUF1629 domain-containing protein [Orientia tsutsugamushi]KJV72873.1 hypothetical protein OTSTA763_1793 [Orientia tsutsugamushi str. TA763]KJV73726.1 hypothetical protein OTSTA763_1461 [Orientia tsutsugamushi str. TA763]SPP26489.1 Uncharacterised protein [Orientia tsutsugamushi]SPR08048.1 Uncharacterised protein [Orientia tsutsugamushi]
MRKTKKLPNKFYETKPLISIANSLDLYDHPFRTGEYGLYQGRPGQRMEEKEYNFIYGTNALQESLIKYDFLSQVDGRAMFLVHKRVLDKLQEMCPDDFQAFPATIKNIKKKNPDFENHDYYVLHIVPLVDAIDKDKTMVKVIHEERWEIKNLIFKENCMGKYLLARVKYKVGIYIFAPELAREFANSRGIEFYSDIEHHSWRLNFFI